MAAALGDLKLVRQHLEENPESIAMSVSEKWFPMANPRAGGKIYIWTLGHNQTPHLVARRFGHEKVFRFLMDHSPLELKLSQACELGDEQTFRKMLKERKPKEISSDERRKLADAAQNNNTHAVRLMLEAGWPVDARGQHNGTALHWAAWHGNAAMTRELLKHNPPIEDVENDFKATPLGWATHGSKNGWYCKSGDYAAVVKMLCEAGAKLPEQVSGTDQVQDMLKRFKSQDAPRKRGG
jgi:hypothetical protein